MQSRLYDEPSEAERVELVAELAMHLAFLLTAWRNLPALVTFSPQVAGRILGEACLEAAANTMGCCQYAAGRPIGERLTARARIEYEGLTGAEDTAVDAVAAPLLKAWLAVLDSWSPAGERPKPPGTILGGPETP